MEQFFKMLSNINNTHKRDEKCRIIFYDQLYASYFQIKLNFKLQKDVEIFENISSLIEQIFTLVIGTKMNVQLCLIQELIL